MALARALVKRPKLLLLDEPLAALDKKLREETQFELMDLQSELGLTFMVVTHDQDEAMTMADRIGGDGSRPARPGRHARTRSTRRPPTAHVAEFVGDINIFEGLVEAGRRRARACAGAPVVGTVELDEETPALTPGETVVVGDPAGEDRAQPRRAGAGGRQRLAGEIWDIGYLGDCHHIQVMLDGEGGQLVTRGARQSHPPCRHGPSTWDDRVWLTWDAEAGVVLPP